MGSIHKSVSKYLHHLEFERRVTPATLKNYRSTLNHFAAWIGDSRISKDDDETIAQYLSSFGHAATANVKAVRIRGLFKYMKMPVDIVRAKEEVRLVKALTSKEVRTLVDTAVTIDLELAAVITFLSETGLRFAEFCALTPASLQSRGSVSWVEVIGKGRKHRKVPLSPAAFEAFGRLPFQPTRWHQEQLRQRLAHAGITARIGTHVHPHLLRRSFISTMLNEKKCEAIKVAKIVGHESVDTMMKHYYRESIEDLHALVS